jgi:hypothetical protein
LLEKHDIVFCLPSISQCEEGWWGSCMGLSVLHKIYG